MNTFGPINFMAVIDVQRNFTNCLCSIRVEENLTCAADLTWKKTHKSKKEKHCLT